MKQYIQSAPNTRPKRQSKLDLGTKIPAPKAIDICQWQHNDPITKRSPFDMGHTTLSRQRSDRHFQEFRHMTHFSSLFFFCFCFYYSPLSVTTGGEIAFNVLARMRGEGGIDLID